MSGHLPVEAPPPSLSSCRGRGWVLVGTTSSGSTAYAARMRARIAERELDVRVLVIETFGHEQIPTVLHATDICSQPSQVEGFGRAALEAMACGVPAVASDTDGLREVVEPERSGLLVALDDEGGLARAILRVHGERRLRERLIRGEYYDQYNRTTSHLGLVSCNAMY